MKPKYDTSVCVYHKKITKYIKGSTVCVVLKQNQPKKSVEKWEKREKIHRGRSE